MCDLGAIEVEGGADLRFPVVVKWRIRALRQEKMEMAIRLGMKL